MGSKFSGGGAGAGTILTDLEVDGTTVVVNATTDKVGIGKAPTNGQLDVAGAISAGSAGSEVHQLTGSLHLSSSSNTTLHLKAQQDCSIRLEADTLNNDEAQNPFIEFIQDGGLTDYTIGLTKLSNNPEGVTIQDIGDNSLAIGANFTDDPIASAATGHVQFYNRLTASFSLIDKGSTNFGGTVDRQGFRVGVGPGFSEANFPKGRMEIHNTSLSPCPALYLAVSGTSQPALVVDAKNTNRPLIEVSASAFDNGALLSAQVGANGSAIALKVKHTTGTSGGTTTTTVANALPANSAVIALGIRVTTGYSAHITKIGVTGDDDFFVAADPVVGVTNVLADGVLEQAGDTIVVPNQRANNNFIASTSDQPLILTHGSSAGGAVRVATYYYEITPPTS